MEDGNTFGKTAKAQQILMWTHTLENLLCGNYYTVFHIAILAYTWTGYINNEKL